jgi:hypothetical protein
MVNYKDLGLVNTREMFKNAMAGKYAIAAFEGQIRAAESKNNTGGSCRM